MQSKGGSINITNKYPGDRHTNKEKKTRDSLTTGNEGLPGGLDQLYCMILFIFQRLIDKCWNVSCCIISGYNIDRYDINRWTTFIGVTLVGVLLVGVIFVDVTYGRIIVGG